MCYIFSHLRQIIVVVLFSVLYIIQLTLTITETNTMETWDLYYDKDFEPITKFIQEQVKVYCRYVGINIGSVQIKPFLPWFNIYRKGDFQEFHHHSNTVLSAVYFLYGNENKGAKLF